MIWLKPEDVAERLGVARKTALGLMAQMEHSVISGKERKRLRVSEEALDRWMMGRIPGNEREIVPIQAGSKRRIARR